MIQTRVLIKCGFLEGGQRENKSCVQEERFCLNGSWYFERSEEEPAQRTVVESEGEFKGH